MINLVKVALVADLEGDLLTSELGVDSLEGVDLVVNRGELLGIQVDLVELVAANLVTAALANDVGGVDKVLEDGLVDSRESAASGTLLVLLGTLAASLGEDAALAEEDDMAVSELLLELADQTLLLLLGLVNEGELGNRNEDHNSELALASGDLTGRLELEGTDIGLEVTGGLKLSKSRGDLELEVGGLRIKDLVGGRHGDFPSMRRCEILLLALS